MTRADAVHIAAVPRVCSFVVIGKPISKGSMRSYGRGRMVEEIKESAPWKERVHWAAKEMWPHPPLTGPVRASLLFLFDRPKHHYGTGRNAGNLKDSAPSYPTSPPDLDKLERNILDAITKVIVRDDAQVVEIESAKHYYDPMHLIVFDRPCVHIKIGPLDDLPPTRTSDPAIEAAQAATGRRTVTDLPTGGRL